MGVDLGSATGYIDLDISGFVSAISEAKATLEKSSKTMSSSIAAFQTKLEGVSKSLTSMGKTMSVAFTAPLTLAFKAAITNSKNFESAMSQVQATMGITTDDLSELNGELVNTKDALATLAEQLGAATKFTATEAAEAINNLAMAGYNTQQVYDTLPTVLSLASAGALDLDYACQLVANGLNVMGLSTANATELADKLAVTASSAYGSVADFGEGILVAGGQAQVANVSLTDTLVALGILGDNGMSASEGGTMLRNVLKNLYTPTNDAAKALAELGIETADADGNLRDVQDVLKDLDKALSGLTADEKVQAMARIFDTRTISGANALLMQCGDRWDELTAKIDEAQGAADRMAETQLDNLAGSFEILSSAVEAFTQSLGDILSPYIRKIADQLAEWTDKLNALDDSQKEQIILIGLVVAAIGPALIILGKLVSAIGSLITVVKAVATVISALLSPGAAVVAILAAIGVAIRDLWQRSETFRNIITGVFDDVKSKFISFKDTLTEKLADIGITTDSVIAILKNLWEGFVNMVGPLVTGAFQSISTFIGTALDTILSLVDVFSGIFTGDWEKTWEGVKNFVSNIWGGIAKIVGVAITSIQNGLKGFLEAIGVDWETAWENIKTFFSSTWQGIVDFFTNAWNAIIGVWNNFKDKFGEPWVSFWNGVSNVFSTVFNSIKTVFTKGLDVILGAVKGAVKGVASVVGLFNKEWADSMKEWADSTNFTAEGVATSVKEAVLETTDNIKELASPVIEATKSAVTTAGEAIGELASEVGKTIVEKYQEGVIEASASSKIKDELAEPVEQGESLAEKAVDKFNEFFGETSGEISSTADETNREIEGSYTETWNSIKAGSSETSQVIVENLSSTNDSISEACETAKQEVADAYEIIQADASNTTTFLSDSSNTVTQEYVNQLSARLDNYKTYYGQMVEVAEESGDEELAAALETYAEIISELEEALATAEEMQKDTTQYVIAEWDGMTQEIGNMLSTVESYYSTTMGYITGVTNSLHEYLSQQRDQEMEEIQGKIDEKNDLYEEMAQTEKDLNEERLKNAKDTYNADLQAAKQNYNSKLAALKEANAQGLLSDQEYKAQKELLDAEYATNKETLATNLKLKQEQLEVELTNTLALQEQERAAYEHEQLVEKDRIARKSFEAQQATDIATAVINAAQAIIKGYAQGGWILGSIYAALTAVATGLQIATIKQQKYTPLLAKGGVVDEATLAVIGEEGKEVVMPLENNTEWIDMLAERLSDKSSSSNSNYNITFNSPKSLDEFEARRQMKMAIRDIAEGF